MCELDVSCDADLFFQKSWEMFKNTFQSGFLSILYSIGSKPLQIWDKKVRNGHIKRITDQDIQVRMAMMNYGFQIRDSNEGSLFAEISQSRRRPLLGQGPSSSRGLLRECKNFDLTMAMVRLQV